MTRKVIFILLPVVMIIMAFFIFKLISSEDLSHNNVYNEEMIQIQNFNITSESTNLQTSANGTIFVKSTDGVPVIQIIASIEVDSNDWGGVTFYIPKNWYISNIKSSYPESKTQKIPRSNIATFTTGDPDYKHNTMIRIGRDHNKENPTGGGTGTVVIDIFPDSEVINTDEIVHIIIALGTDGSRIMETDSVKVPIKLTEEG